jgi:hypothetical protein
MRLKSGWQLILRKAWSVRFSALSIIFAIADVTLPLFGDVIPRNTFAILLGATAAGSIIARLVAQTNLSN